jgi:cation/acetate symporter
MVGLAFAVAASGNFPALLLSLYWRRMTTWGAVTAIIVGTVSALVLILISPTVWVDVLGNSEAIFPLKNPAIVSMSLAFLSAIIVSLLTREQGAEERFVAAERQIHLGAAVPPKPEVSTPALPMER